MFILCTIFSRYGAFRDLLQSYEISMITIHTNGKMKSICFIHQKCSERIMFSLLCDVIRNLHSSTRTNEIASFI